MRYQRRRFPNGNLHPMSAEDRAQKKQEEMSRRWRQGELGGIPPLPLEPPIIKAIWHLRNAILWLIAGFVFLGLMVTIMWYIR